VADRLRAAGVDVELVLITTSGDQQQAGPLAALGGQGLFTKELQRALLAGQVDLAVHSLKDLPTQAVSGLVLAAVPPRAPEGDVLVSRGRVALQDLPPGAVVGTGSARRRAQLLHARPDLQMADIRGNVETRLRKLSQGQFDALVLAEAGLRRLGLDDAICQVLPKTLILPAPGQGALGLETRADDSASRDAVARLDDPATRAAVTAERALLESLGAGCLAPVGAWGRIEHGMLRLSACILDPHGQRKLCGESTAQPDRAVGLGAYVAAQLMGQGATELIRAARTP
jgi:hydroxymethylbilane synthase